MIMQSTGTMFESCMSKYVDMGSSLDSGLSQKEPLSYKSRAKSSTQHTKYHMIFVVLCVEQ